ncbi:ABC transporter permease subunit [Bythopirellula polymerisocia]|uniref:ABC-2 family transporter protein n=1 Tax=Bythopirellula polymerisocia TaxID=2528003 RepID=A0A5C6C8A0_9BACT|nr:ABC transporter permease subunit [Bythopirellula polymerisocia]TWU20382.1 ABC-2 family transporter protein [Bythopirellula polymerisocia]
MYLFENPVLQKELVSNLRMNRTFVLLFAYVALLGLLVYAAWPAEERLDMSNSDKAKPLVNLLFLGQYMLMSLMAPSFAAGAITGEKERDSFEMLMASPVKPGAIVFGKLAASLCPLAELMIGSLPVVMLCLPLGGVQFFEVVAAYLAMISSVTLFTAISLWCSSYFSRTSASLVVSYLLILPLAMLGVFIWQALEQLGEARLVVVFALVPLVCLSATAMLVVNTSKRLLAAPDLGSAGQQAIDLSTEAESAVGLYIKREEFPDRLFAPPKRTTFLPEDANPIYDKEIRSEIFSQGTLMLRLVIQISMGLALPLMAVLLYLKPHLAPWYIAYVLLFNMLVGPVFTAGSVTSERERQTLDLLLTTLISPWQMMWGKLLSGLRVSSVLTSFLMWPVVLACIMPLDFWHNLPTMIGYAVVVALACCTTAMTALFCSTLFHKSSTSLLASYLIIVTLFLLPLAANRFVHFFGKSGTTANIVEISGIASPFVAIFNLPLEVSSSPGTPQVSLSLFGGHLLFSLLYNGALLLTIMWLFQVRWRVSDN